MNANLEQIWNDFAEKLRQFIRARVADAATAEDILMDVFAKIQTRLGQLHDPAKLQGWIFLIARNAIIDHYRTLKKTTAVPDTLPADAEPTPDENEGLQAALRGMMESLPGTFRAALVLTEFDGLTQQELAARLGISLSGAKSRVQRGREQLRRMMNACCTFEFDRRGGVAECTPRPAAKCEGCCGSDDDAPAKKTMQPKGK